MMFRLTYSTLLYCFLALFATSFTAHHVKAQPATGIRASALYIQAPLLKEMTHNGVIRVRVDVPAGKEANYKSMQLSLDAAALDAIERIDLLARDDREAAFLPGAPVLASAKPSSLSTEIPVQLSCRPGLNYLWVSVVLKKTADPDKKVRLKVNSLTSATGQKQVIASQVTSNGTAPDFFYRVGIAIRKAGDDNVHTYRIPGIVTTDKGTLIAVYDNRNVSTKDIPGNIDIGMSRSTDGGKTWEPMKVVMDMGAPHETNGAGDPSILFDPVTKKIWVAALWSKGNRAIAGSEPGLSPDTTGQFVLVSSDDDGLTWSQPCNITAQIKDPVWHLYFQGPGSGIAMQNGTLVFPSQYWDESKKPGMPHSSIIYSTDHGKTWKSGIGAKSNTTESQVVETIPGTLMLNMRDNRGSFRSIATTTDMGKTWVEHHTSQQALPDPVCMASIIKANVTVKGKQWQVLFFSNMAMQTSRQNTTVKASLDLGETWLPANQLLIDARKSYGYSCMTRIDEHTIGLLYEGIQDLYFVRIPVKDIIK